MKYIKKFNEIEENTKFYDEAQSLCNNIDELNDEINEIEAKDFYTPSN